MKMRWAFRLLVVLAAAAILPACRHLPHHHHRPFGLDSPPAAPAEAPRSASAGG